MLQTYGIDGGILTVLPLEDDAICRAAWIDLLNPTDEEEKRIERVMGIEVPTRDEMREIEPSSRLYIEDSWRYLTAALVIGSDTKAPFLSAVTFVLHEDTLITVRYEDPKAFQNFRRLVAKSHMAATNGEVVLYGLLDAVIDRLADILESAGDDIDALSRSIFATESDDHARSYREDMRTLGRKAELIAKVRESLISLARLVNFLRATRPGTSGERRPGTELQIMLRDVEALSAHADSLIGKGQFLLDAVVGLVSIEQNNIIKIFAVLSVILMPPTLVASVYGMNFRNMPELGWTWGYPAALGLMVVAGALPWLFFKWKRWL